LVEKERKRERERRRRRKNIEKGVLSFSSIATVEL